MKTQAHIAAITIVFVIIIFMCRPTLIQGNNDGTATTAGDQPIFI